MSAAAAAALDGKGEGGGWGVDSGGVWQGRRSIVTRAAFLSASTTLYCQVAPPSPTYSSILLISIRLKNRSEWLDGLKQSGCITWSPRIHSQ